MQALETRDYFSDHSILRDPYAFFEAVRAQGPVYKSPQTGIVYVTGFDEIISVMSNTEDFSAVASVQGPAAPLPFKPEGHDISQQIEAHRHQFIGGDLVVAYDGQQHSFSRSLLNRLFTPSRLKANEEFIARYSDELVRGVVAKGGCELIKEIATPFVTMVIADLLGVPEGDRQIFMDAIDAGVPPGSLNAEDLEAQNQPLILMGMYFAQYVQDRRTDKRPDILSELSNASFPDGSTPDAMEIARIATFLFGAGQDTSAKLLGNALRYISDQPGLQQQLREDPSRIPALLEEVLRLEGSVKMTSRLARKDTRIGDLAIPAGTQVALAVAAGNRDPRRWDHPAELVLDRPRIKEHVGFGRGAHVCIGAPLARVEVRVILEKFLEYTANIEIDETVHGPRGNRRLDYEASFIIRGLAALNLKLTPSEKFKASAPAAKPEKKFGFFGIGKKAEPKPVPTHYSTAETKIGALLADPAAKAVLDKYFPGVSSDSRIGMAKSMTLRAIQRFAPDMFSVEKLDAADKELATLKFN